jgi:hypothetical protein
MQQALDSRDETAFLPGYYALLNLAKLYILFSDRHGELASNRLHGASYDSHSKVSKSLETETIILRSRGALPLLYAVLTGERYLDRTQVQLRDAYSYIPSISVEWQLAAKTKSRLARLEAQVQTDQGVDTPVIMVESLDTAETSPARNRLKVLRTWRRVVGKPNQYVGVAQPQGSCRREDLVRVGLRPELLYMSMSADGLPLTPISGRSLLLPEELPILLAFFHLSSIVRYQPEFVARVRDSRYWPAVASLRWQGLLQAAQLLLSYVRQECLYVLPLGGG